MEQLSLQEQWMVLSQSLNMFINSLLAENMRLQQSNSMMSNNQSSTSPLVPTHRFSGSSSPLLYSAIHSPSVFPLPPHRLQSHDEEHEEKREIDDADNEEDTQEEPEKDLQVVDERRLERERYRRAKEERGKTKKYKKVQVSIMKGGGVTPHLRNIDRQLSRGSLSEGPVRSKSLGDDEDHDDINTNRFRFNLNNSNQIRRGNIHHDVHERGSVSEGDNSRNLGNPVLFKFDKSNSDLKSEQEEETEDDDRNKARSGENSLCPSAGEEPNSNLNTNHDDDSDDNTNNNNNNNTNNNNNNNSNTNSELGNSGGGGVDLARVEKERY